MFKKLRHFKCDNNHVFERIVTDDIKEIDCKECELKAKRQLAAPRSFQNTVGKSPSRL